MMRSPVPTHPVGSQPMTADTIEPIGTTIRRLRTERGWSQETLSRLVGVSANMPSRYETGAAEPSLDTLARLAQVFGVSADYMLGLTDDPAPSWEPPTPDEIRRQALDDLARVAGRGFPRQRATKRGAGRGAR